MVALVLAQVLGSVSLEIPIHLSHTEAGQGLRPGGRPMRTNRILLAGRAFFLGIEQVNSREWLEPPEN